MRTDAHEPSSGFDPHRHDASHFDSGDQSLDDWLRNHAEAAARARVARTFVWLDDHGSVVGYYALSANAIPRRDAPTRIGRGVPDPVPAALIAKLALDRRQQGRGLGGVLLVDALLRIIETSESGPAVRAIVVDAATDRGRSLYRRFGFVPMASDSNRMVIRAEVVARALGRR